jgi:hypothetical protein
MRWLIRCNVPLQRASRFRYQNGDPEKDEVCPTGRCTTFSSRCISLAGSPIDRRLTTGRSR